MRRLLLALAFVVAGCAASTAASTPDGGDMSINHCDLKTLFSQCSQQCGFRVCFVGSGTSCEGTTWTCTCSDVTPCAGDGGLHD